MRIMIKDTVLEAGAWVRMDTFPGGLDAFLAFRKSRVIFPRPIFGTKK